MKMIDRNKLIAKIKETCPWTTDAAAEMRADRLLSEIPGALTVNVEEWINGEKLSDIFVDEYCVNAIMEIRGDKLVFDAIEALVLYSRDKEAGKRRIWRTRK